MTLSHLLNYYQDINESNRLFKDNQHKTEFIVTSTYLKKYLKDNDNLLDIGSGPGIYSIFSAQLGAKVTAFDLVSEHLTQLEEKVKNTPLQDKIICHQGNALDLSQFTEESFDLVLNLGPLYHLNTAKEKETAISESLRVLKHGGIVLIAYINKYFKFFQRILKNQNPIKWDVMDNIIQKGYKHDIDEAVFYFLSPKEAEDLLSSHNGTIKHHVSTDGISYLMADAINSMNEEDFAKYMGYHMELAKEPHLLGSSLHNMIVFEKD